MSRGYGSRERAILRALDRHPGKWVRLTPGLSPSAAAAQRRAARSLAAAGVIDLERRARDGRSWLVARRHSEPVIPHDLDVVLEDWDRRDMLASRTQFATEAEWRARQDSYRRELQQRLWDTVVAQGLTIAQAQAVLGMVSDQRK